MDAILTSLSAEALKTWGAFAILLIALGVMLWRSENRLKDEQAANEKLREQISAIQEKRLQDAQGMIRVAESGTATMAARTQGDQRFLEVLGALVDEVAALKDAHPAMAPDAQPERRRPRNP